MVGYDLIELRITFESRKVSNCNARSNRQEYVRILSKYISVDIFSQDGRCGGTDACPRSKNYDVCYNMIEQDYKFYFAFENSICEDYVTEKFFEMLSRGIVPVVMGGADYASIAPSHSYINALDYSPRELVIKIKDINISNDYSLFQTKRPSTWKNWTLTTLSTLNISGGSLTTASGILSTSTGESSAISAKLFIHSRSSLKQQQNWTNGTAMTQSA